MNDEAAILQRLRNHDIKAFKILCIESYETLEDFAFSLVNDANLSREIVSDVLGWLWAKEAFSNASLPILEFLNGEVRKECERRVTHEG